MSLINIDYGSLASSETMNKNFMYLENKVAENTESLMTSISSILSNIATINSRITDLSENLKNCESTFNTQLEDNKAQTTQLINKTSMLPNWSSCVAIKIIPNSQDVYVALSNGYILAVPESNAKGEILINNVAVNFKNRSNSYDNSAQLTIIPVSKNDEITTTATLSNVYFLPVQEISIENF